MPHASGLTLNLRRPWPPVRGWVVQQIMKMAGTAALDARAVLVIDSDAVLLREARLDYVMDNGRLWHFRRDGEVTAEMSRQILWHNVARKLLGLPGVASLPAPQYISPITVWSPAVVRSLLAHIKGSTGRRWMDAVAGELHVSEFVIYGVFVDQVLGGMEPFEGPVCHNYYERVPLSRADALAFADGMPSTALGAMISSHSDTPQDVRREAFAQCRRVAGRSSQSAPRAPQAASIKASPGWTQRCLDVAVLVGQLSALAPAGLA